ncbi:MAG: TolB family protein [Tsuneonella sp.]
MRGWRLNVSVASLVLASLAAAPALAQSVPDLETAPPGKVTDRPAAHEPGPSGLPYTPPAQPGQTLPLQPARHIDFTVSEATALQPDLSPDGKTLTFAILGDIYVLPAKGGTAKALTRGLAMDTQPAFSPDGKWIAFLSDRSGAENLWVMRADGSGALQVSFYDSDQILESPSWSADGI